MGGALGEVSDDMPMLFSNGQQVTSQREMPISSSETPSTCLLGVEIGDDASVVESRIGNEDASVAQISCVGKDYAKGQPEVGSFRSPVVVAASIQSNKEQQVRSRNNAADNRSALQEGQEVIINNQEGNELRATGVSDVTMAPSAGNAMGPSDQGEGHEVPYRSGSDERQDGQEVIVNDQEGNELCAIGDATMAPLAENATRPSDEGEGNEVRSRSGSNEPLVMNGWNIVSEEKEVI